MSAVVYLNRKEVAKIFGFGYTKVHALGKAGMPFPFAGKTTEKLVRQWLAEHPDFSMLSVCPRRFYDKKSLAERLGCDSALVDQMRQAGLPFSHGSQTLLTGVLDWLQENPQWGNQVPGWMLLRKSRHPKKELVPND